MTAPKQVLDLTKPMNMRAEMARGGIAPMQMHPYEDAERGWVDPLDGDEAKTTLRCFLAALWRACERAEANQRQEATDEWVGKEWAARGGGSMHRLIAAIPEPEPPCGQGTPGNTCDGCWKIPSRLCCLWNAEPEPEPLPPSFVPAGNGWCPVHGTAACPEQYMLMSNGDVAPGYKGHWSESMRCGRREQTYRLTTEPEPLPPHVCDVAGCEEGFPTMEEVIAHERLHDAWRTR